MALSAPGAVIDVVRRLIAGGIQAVVHLERGPLGRRVVAVAELAPTAPTGGSSCRFANLVPLIRRLDAVHRRSVRSSECSLGSPVRDD
jgi:hypothetical protein